MYVFYEDAVVLYILIKYQNEFEWCILQLE